MKINTKKIKIRRKKIFLKLNIAEIHFNLLKIHLNKFYFNSLPKKVSPFLAKKSSLNQYKKNRLPSLLQCSDPDPSHFGQPDPDH